MHQAPVLVASALTLALLSSCQTASPPLLNSAEAVRPVLAGKEDLLLFECTFFTAPDNFELLRNTKENHIAGVFSPEDGERLIKELKRRRKFEHMSSPSITTRQGQHAKIEIIREFIYPTEFDPPKAHKVDPATGDGASSFPVTPTTPTAFETKNLGITAAYKGRTTADGGIAFEFEIEHVNFLGFVNYGSPITTNATDARGNPTQVILTENKIEQPVFGTKRLSSTVTLSNGHYVAVGGMRSDIQNSLDARTKPGPARANPGLEHDRNLFALIKVTAVKP
jgi:hypothetical protein